MDEEGISEVFHDMGREGKGTGHNLDKPWEHKE